MGRKYLVAVVLLAVLAVAFGAVGTFAPPLPESELTPVVPQQDSEPGSTAHFQNPPTFDSGWVNIADKQGQYFNITHNLNYDDVLVDIAGKVWEGGSVHQKYLGLTWLEIAGWSKTYAHEWQEPPSPLLFDYGYSLVQTDDGGYAIAGYTCDMPSEMGGLADMFLVRTDASGNQLWQKTFGAEDDWMEDDRAYSLIQTGDGGYALAGYTSPYYTPTSDFWLVKTDSAGNMEWNKTYGGPDTDEAYSLVQTSDGGYALAGYTLSSGGGENFWLVKTDSVGNAQWNKTYGRSFGDRAQSVVQTSDGGYLIAGYTDYGPFNAHEAWLVKTNSTGDVKWNQTYGDGGSYDDEAFSVVQTSDGGYAFAGRTNFVGAGGFDVWLIKTNSSGYGSWGKTFGGTAYDVGYSLVQTGDGGYAIAGYTDSFGAVNGDVFLVKTDVSGNQLWQKTFGGTRKDDGRSLVQTDDRGYAIAGYTETLGADEIDVFVVKTDVEGEFGLARTGSTADTLTLYRGRNDVDWNFVRVRAWRIEEPTWIYGDINMDGVVDAKDLYILSRNYGQTFSLISLSGIVAIAGIHTVKKRKQAK